MHAPTPAELLRGYYLALDEADLDQLDALFAEQITWSFPGVTLHTAADVKRSLGRSLATGLTMQHDIRHMLERGGVAICELVATNRLPSGIFTVPGAVVCEATDGRITRLAAYPEAEAMRAFLAALSATPRRGE